MSITGEHAAVPESKPVEAIAKALPARIFQPGALTLIVALGVGGVVSVSGYALAQSNVKNVVDAGVKPVANELERFKAETSARMARIEAKQDEQQRLAAVKEERDAARFDVIYGTILSGRRDPRADSLAAPAVTDGGR